MDSKTRRLRSLASVGRWEKLLLSVSVVFLSLQSLLAESYLNKRVRLTVKDSGAQVVGVVVKETEVGDLSIQLSSGGSVTYKRDQIGKVEVLKPPAEEFAERARKCKSADDWVELAKWCVLEDVNLPEKRKQCLEQALKLNADHEGAHRELRHIKVNGKWMDEEEGNKALGNELVDGKWVSKAEAERLRRVKEEREKKRALRGYEQFETERLGKDWAIVAPITTRYCILKCNSTEKVAGYYKDVVDAIFSEYKKYLDEKKYPGLFSEKGRIFIFRNHQEFMDFTLAEPGMGGYVAFHDNAVRAYHGSFGVNEATETTLSHEICHTLQRRMIQNMESGPRWLIEGMATYYGDGAKVSRNKVELCQISQQRLQWLQHSIDTGMYTSFRNVLRQPPPFPGGFYSNAWGVIYWCLKGRELKAHNGEGEAIWNAYFDHVCKDMPPYSENFMAYMGNIQKEAEVFESLVLKHYPSFDAWEEKFKQFVMKLPLESMGDWKGRNLWVAKKPVEISIQFPQGFDQVKPKDLLLDIQEATAVQTPDRKARISLFLTANWLETMDEKKIGPMARSFVRQYFRIVESESDDEEEEEEPKVEGYKGNPGVLVVQFKFKGKYAKRKMHEVGGRGQPAKPGSKEKAEKTEKSEKDKRPAVTPVDYNQVQTVKTAIYFSNDRVFFVFLAAPEAEFVKKEALFDRMIESGVTFDFTQKR
ncbi:MAG: hypothetical protein HY717_22435 [Planctomycetes bacterium]|nr:hypothetical protein [Planctomycetota bacterium]